MRYTSTPGFMSTGSFGFCISLHSACGIFLWMFIIICALSITYLYGGAMPRFFSCSVSTKSFQFRNVNGLFVSLFMKSENWCTSSTSLAYSLKKWGADARNRCPCHGDSYSTPFQLFGSGAILSFQNLVRHFAWVAVVSVMNAVLLA